MIKNPNAREVYGVLASAAGTVWTDERYAPAEIAKSSARGMNKWVARTMWAQVHGFKYFADMPEHQREQFNRGWNWLWKHYWLCSSRKGSPWVYLIADQELLEGGADYFERYIG